MAVWRHQSQIMGLISQSDFTIRHCSSYLKKIRIKHVRCTPQHSHSNRKIKCFNCTFNEILAKTVNNSPCDWEDHVGFTLLAHRISTSDVTLLALLFTRQPRLPLSWLLHARDPIQGFGNRVDGLSTACRAARGYTDGSRKYKRSRLAKKANDGLLVPRDMVLLLAPEPLTLTSKWDPQWQVTRVSGTKGFLRHQQSGQNKMVHRRIMPIGESL